MNLNTRNIWREQSFAFVDEASSWLSRDYYNNDVAGVLSDLNVIIEWAEGMIENFLERD
jgi:hypothetical protein